MEDLEQKAKMLKAVANPRRICIVKALYDGPKTFTQLMDACVFRSGGELSFHLGVLRGFVRKREDGLYELTRAGRRLADLIEIIDEAGVAGSLRRVRPGLLEAVVVALTLALLTLDAFYLAGRINASSLMPDVLTYVTVSVVMLVVYLFRFELLERYPYLINLPAFTYIISHPFLDPQTRGNIVNKVFRVHLFVSLFFAFLAFISLKKNVLGDVRIINNALMAVIVVFLASSFLYYRHVYRTVIEKL